MAGINYDDERFTEVESQRQEALTENEKLYGGMIDKSDQFYQEQINESKEWADKQSQLQQEKTDFAIEQIEQQKEQAQKDYTKEQKGAYTDWKKQSNEYGAQAEQMAASGLANTGFNESSKVSMYNTYQNRVATARESLNKAVLNYNNAIKEAQLQNNSALAEIAHNALLQQLELSLQGFQYKNQLLLDEADNKLAINSMFDSKYQAVVDQINTENALAEQKRQFDAQMAYQREQDERDYQLQLQQLEESQRQFDIQNESYNIAPDIVSTAYYEGEMNPDAYVFGTFSNGYQPKGISGYGEVKKSGSKTVLTTQTLSGEIKVVTQNVWETTDGTKWYWDGRYNKYIRMSEKTS